MSRTTIKGWKTASTQVKEPKAISTQETPNNTRDDDDDIIQAAAFTPANGVEAKQSFSLSPTKAALAGALFISALVVLFLFTAKAVTIQIQPTATLSVSGGLKFKLADHYLLMQGNYQLEALADGYYPLSETLTIGDAQNQTLSFELERLPGHLTINTPGINAPVTIDQIPVGNTNQEIRDIAAGEHHLIISAERYFPHEQSLEITGLDTAQSLTLSLEPAWADVSFSTQPQGATLFVDGEAFGTTPLQVELLEGEHQLRLKLAGHKAWQENLNVKAQTPIDLPLITLPEADGLILVNTQPSGAGLTVNGTYRGQSPFELALPPGKVVEITAFKVGYASAKQSIKVESGKEQALTIKLKPQLGEVKIDGRPSDALLYVDGRLMGRAKQTLRLPAKQHRITFKKEGYEDFSTTVLPRPGIAQAVGARLLTLEQAKWKNIKPVISTAAGSKLKLFKIDAKFKMGASRREQGRRSNESLRSVALKRAFYLGTHEVTNAQYREFVKFHSSGHVKGNSLNGEKYPVVKVTWDQAARYCNWLSEQEKLPPFYTLENDTVNGFNPQSNGYRLPTEAEWSWAARVQEDGKLLKFPWGPSLPPAEKSGNYGDRRAAALLGNIQVNYDDGFAVTAPVGSFPANGKGLYDLGGNVAEWVSDYYGIKTGLSLSLETDPAGPTEGSHHVIRGSSWGHGTVTDLRLAFRDYNSESRHDVGFRVARYVD